MLIQLLIGFGVVVVTAVIHATILSTAYRSNQRLTDWVVTNPHRWRLTAAFTMSVTWVMFAHLIEVLLWSVIYLVLGIFDAIEPALYFSLVAYTTLGFGDVVLPESWRLLSGITAANGFLVFGWSTAFQVEYISRLSRGFQTNRPTGAGS
ncbi:MAG: ion channel [Woeseiaceae bacterium]|nr:ion channel [Woeseiaceae bacterium]